MRILSVLSVLSVSTALSVSSLAAQQDALTRGLDLERRGNYDGAAESYRVVLRDRPAEIAALLGLERSLGALNRLPEMVPQIQAAVATRPTATTAYSVALRVWTILGKPDSARKVVELWTEVQPADETPYREWANAALALRDRPAARCAYELARSRLGRDDVLAAELAQLAVAEEDSPVAVREWLQAMRRLPGYRVMAVTSLGGVRERNRPVVLRELDREGSPEARQTAASLRARWGDPVVGFRQLESALPTANPAALEILRQFQDLLLTLGTRDASRALGMTVEAMSVRAAGQQVSRLRLEAARRYADAGDSESAHRMLDLLAGDGDSPRSLAADAAATLIGVLLDEGKVEQAAADLERHRAIMQPEQVQALARRVALGWAHAGDLDRAETTVAGDSSVEALALAGRLRLFRGDLAGAAQLLQAAGPYAGTRSEATERAGLLALLQPIEEDSLPELGAALLSLERGDTAAALQGLEQLAGKLPAEAGGAELRFMSGQLCRAQGDQDGAERAFRVVVSSKVPSAAPTAAVELARLLAATGRAAEAQEVLEQAILDYPKSAILPQARRLLDEVKGAVPRT